MEVAKCKGCGKEFPKHNDSAPAGSGFVTGGWAKITKTGFCLACTYLGIPMGYPEVDEMLDVLVVKKRVEEIRRKKEKDLKNRGL